LNILYTSKEELNEEQTLRYGGERVRERGEEREGGSQLATGRRGEEAK